MLSPARRRTRAPAMPPLLFDTIVAASAAKDAAAKMAARRRAHGYMLENIRSRRRCCCVAATSAAARARARHTLFIQQYSHPDSRARRRERHYVSGAVLTRIVERAAAVAEAR